MRRTVRQLISGIAFALLLAGIAPVGSQSAAAAYCGPQWATLKQGPRGGCFYINSNGNKTYVDRSCCR